MLFPGTSASARELRIRVNEGQSIQALAVYFYGAAWKKIYILSRNGLLENARLRSGTRLSIPQTFSYIYKPHYNLEQLAERRLGGSHRLELLLAANGFGKKNSAQDGSIMIMPFHLRHEVKKGDSWKSLAQIYYQDPKWAKSIRAYNKGSKLQEGVRLVIPIFDKATLDISKKRPWPPEKTSKSKSPTKKPNDHRGNGTLDPRSTSPKIPKRTTHGN